MASMPLTSATMAHLPPNKALMLMYKTQIVVTAYIPLVVSLALSQCGKRPK